MNSFLGTFLLLVILNFNTNVEGFGIRPCHRSKDHTWYVLGIYSACYGQASRTKLNLLAEDLDKAVRYVWNLRATKPELFPAYFRPIKVKYVSLDVCGDFHKLPEIIESIHLDEEYHYATWSRKSLKPIYLSRVVAIYAEVPTEMMNYLESSFPDNARFTGRYVSFNTSINVQRFDHYSSLLLYLFTHNLKWNSLIILNVKPSALTPLYEFLIQKAAESQMCVQYKDIDQPWKIDWQKDFPYVWSQENKPAVITIGDQYGQIEIIKQLAEFMKRENIVIPILAEGFHQSFGSFFITDLPPPENFDCFKDISSSFLTTGNDDFAMDEKGYKIIDKVSQFINRTNIPINQQSAFSLSYFLDDRFVRDIDARCSCPLHFQCTKYHLDRQTKHLKSELWDRKFNPKLNEYEIRAIIFDPKQPFQAGPDVFSEQCRKLELRALNYTQVINPKLYDSCVHKNHDQDDHFQIHSQDLTCW